MKKIVFSFIISVIIIFIAHCDSTPPKTETPQPLIDNQPINDI